MLVTCWWFQWESCGTEGPDLPRGSHRGFAFDFRGNRAEGIETGVFFIYRGGSSQVMD